MKKLFLFALPLLALGMAACGGGGDASSSGSGSSQSSSQSSSGSGSSQSGSGSSSSQSSSSSSSQAGGVDVTFSVKYGTDMGDGVYLAGDFNEWARTVDYRLEHQGDPENTWKITVTLEPGTYEYKFCIDSYDTPGAGDAKRWEADPNRSVTVVPGIEEQVCNWQA